MIRFYKNAHGLLTPKAAHCLTAHGKRPRDQMDHLRDTAQAHQWTPRIGRNL